MIGRDSFCLSGVFGDEGLEQVESQSVILMRTFIVSSDGRNKFLAYIEQHVR